MCSRFIPGVVQAAHPALPFLEDPGLASERSRRKPLGADTARLASWSSVLRRSVLWCVLSLTLAAALIGAVLVLIARWHLPISSLPLTVLLLGLSGAALGLVFTFRLTGPALSR